MSLTVTEIKALKPLARPFKTADGKGLYLEVFPNGSKLWRWKYRIAGKEKRMAFGAWPDVSLAKARELRDTARGQLVAGNDPSLERKKARAALQFESTNTFAAIGTEYIEKKMVGDGRADGTLKKARWFFGAACAGNWKNACCASRSTNAVGSTPQIGSQR